MAHFVLVCPGMLRWSVLLLGLASSGCVLGGGIDLPSTGTGPDPGPGADNGSDGGLTVDPPPLEGSPSGSGGSAGGGSGGAFGGSGGVPGLGGQSGSDTGGADTGGAGTGGAGTGGVGTGGVGP